MPAVPHGPSCSKYISDCVLVYSSTSASYRSCLKGVVTPSLLQVIRNRLDVYHREATPVEEFFKQQGTLINFEITAGIPETLPGLLGNLRPHIGNWEIADVSDVDTFS